MNSADPTAEPVDRLIIGGGVNGCGIARDAAGRGLSVTLCEMGDLAQATSSASTKLFHGGLRYLEHYQFRLVREALIEREKLWRAMPHIARPIRFVLPHHKGLRPAWLLRLGLFLYDHLGGRKLLPATCTLDLRRDPAGAPLKPVYAKAFEYSDCWVGDARLVVLNARAAAQDGATILTRTKLISAERANGFWLAELQNVNARTRRTVKARALINAGGPWVEDIQTRRLRANTPARVRLVRGSHIVVPKLFAHDRSYIFQNADGRIVFAIPYEDDFTLIGTTDRDHEGDPLAADCTSEEAEYLCAAVSEYFAKPVQPGDIVWTFSGVRSLFDDGAKSASSASRDYMLRLEDCEGDLPVLHVFGGKITTYRKLAEAALARLKPYFPAMDRAWTADAALCGGEFTLKAAESLRRELAADYPFLTDRWSKRLWRTYGRSAWTVLGDARATSDLGQNFGWDLTETEVAYLIRHEWAQTAEDVLWRRTKLGLRLSANQAAQLTAWMERRPGVEPDSIAKEA